MEGKLAAESNDVKQFLMVKRYNDDSPAHTGNKGIKQMALVFFGIGFGLMMGTGLFFLVIRPALKERKDAEKAEKTEIDKD